jgi:fused signal recognition particle receptor
VFGFLKDKLKKAVARFTKEVEEEPEKEQVKEKPEATPKKAVLKKSFQEPAEKKGKKPVKKDEKAPKEQVTKGAARTEEITAKEEDIESIDKRDGKTPKEQVTKSAARTEEITSTEEDIESIERKENKTYKNLVKDKNGIGKEKKEAILQTEGKQPVEQKEQAPKVQVIIDAVKEEPKKGFFGRLKDKIKGIPADKDAAKTATEAKQATVSVDDRPAAELTEQIEEEQTETKRQDEEQREPTLEQEARPEKEGFFGKITEAFSTRSMSDERFEELFYELEIGLLENNVALEVIDKIRTDLKEELVNKRVRVGKAQQAVEQALLKSIKGLFEVPQIDLIKAAEGKKPLVIVFVGVNGSGKTTTIAKVASLFKDIGKVPVIAAADTFRAAAIQQLEEHAHRLGVKMIKHDYGSDPAAVAFDAIRYADAKKADVVLIDTAGRLHSNSNLMDEMKKIVRVAKPDLKIFIGEAITGNDCVEQARQFNEAIGIDGIILSKADVDDKGGAAISVSYVTGKPILYLGNGQEYDKLTRFQPSLVTEGLGL